MIALATRKRAFSFKRELVVVLVSLGVLILLPAAILMAATNVGALADSANQIYTGSAPAGDTYDFGYCTYWASKRRAEVGLPIPQNWGDAHSWDDNAFLAGYKVDHTPQQYAIMQTDAGDLGHVAFVEEVGTDGSWKVSEMNVKGWDILSDRTFKPSQAKDYNFIH